MIQIGFKSDRGKRRNNNEDACFVMPKENVYMVADGVGGNNAGECASNMAVSKIAECIRENSLTGIEDQNEIAICLKRYIEIANKEIIDFALHNKENRGMATTLVMCYIKGDTLYIANIGDSRAYIYRQGELFQITEDHSYVNSLIKMGAITHEEAKDHEKGHMITKALGAAKEADADYYQTKIVDGDVVLLCTDGLYGELSEGEIEKLISQEGDMSKLAEKLIAYANEAGGRDNITAVCIKTKGGCQYE
ncbi:MAG: Stp1/IreP family PP2C-type Ser/Thr phosphatase [Anaerovoracaceae bacterium]